MGGYYTAGSQMIYLCHFCIVKNITCMNLRCCVEKLEAKLNGKGRDEGCY
jgi:hypothetical protein